MAEFDTSVNLEKMGEINVVTEMDAEAFETAVYKMLLTGKVISDLGCGRILVDWSVLMRNRYVLCDIYEQDAPDTGTDNQVLDSETDDKVPVRKSYRIDIKAGEKASPICDIVYCALFLIGFWLLRNYFTMLNPLFLVLVVLDILFVAWLYFEPRRTKFGKAEAGIAVSELESGLASFNCEKAGTN